MHFVSMKEARADPSNPYQFVIVLRSICRNATGLFWAGDTAQTISIGSSFRFNDLKALLYRNEVRIAINSQLYCTLTIRYALVDVPTLARV